MQRFLQITEQNRKWWILVAMTGCVSMIFIDITVLPVALPTMHRDLKLTELGMQWVINSYTLALTVLLLAGGRLADLLGLRRAFCFGLVIFSTASLLAGLSTAQWWLIASRVLQGFGGALLLPSTQAIITASFSPNERGKALGLYVSIGSIFLALGPVLGGVFSEYLTWRYVFWINLPIAALSLALSLASVPRFESKKEPFDYFGFFTLGCGVTALVVALMQAQNWGWTSPLILTLFGLGLLLILSMIIVDRKISHPLVHFRLFKDKTLSICSLVVSLTQALIMVTVFWAIYLQTILGYSPAQAGGLTFLGNCPVLFAAPIAGYLVDIFGPRLPISLGLSLIFVSLFWFLLFPDPAIFPMLLPALIPFGFGISMIFTPSFVTIMNRSPAHLRGMVAGTNSALRQFASTLGLALFGTIFFQWHEKRFSEVLHSHTATKELSTKTFEGLISQSPQSIQAISQLPKTSAAIVLEGDKIATISAFSAINFSALIFAAAGLAIGFFLLKNASREEMDNF